MIHKLFVLALFMVCSLARASHGLDIVFDTTGNYTGNVAALSSTDLSTIWGDAIQLSHTGILSSFSFPVFTSGSSTGNLTSATVTISFYDYTGGTIGTSLGSFTGNISSLNKGFYSIYTSSTLESLNINLNVTDILVTQQLSNVVGASRMGIVFLNNLAGSTPTVGTNLTPSQIYQSNTTNTAGWYTVSSYSYANIPYQVGLVSVPEPSTYAMSVAGLAFIGLLSKYRLRVR